MLDRDFYAMALVRAEDHVLKCEGHIARQQEIIARKERLGMDCAESNTLLMTFQTLLICHRDHRAELLKTMEEIAREEARYAAGSAAAGGSSLSG
jgi:hypothetical protein